MSETDNFPRQRLPNGSVAKRRIFVAMPQAMLERVETMAAAERRSASAMVTLLLKERLTEIDHTLSPADGYSVLNQAVNG
jgi:metal-responsive CopG/Arc/MetJ family transcriptional regulator